MKITKRRLLEGGAAAVATSLFSPGSWAQRASGEAAWPTKPIHILVGFPAGASPDLAARAVAEPLSKILRQPVVVENKPGASGNLVAEQVAKATDDHTIGALINGNLTIARLLNPAIAFDPEKDFAPVGLIGTAPLVLAVSGNAVGKTPADLLLWVRNLGGAAKYGTPGVGTVGHLGMELLKSRVAGFRPEHVPYQGNPQVITAMLGDQVQMGLIPPGVAMPQIKAGKLKAIGLSGGRSALVPEVPPLADAGVHDFNLEVWVALLGPANLSKAAQARIGSALEVVMKEPDVRRKLFEQGWQAVGTSPDGMRIRVNEEAAIMTKIISTRGIKLQ